MVSVKSLALTLAFIGGALSVDRKCTPAYNNVQLGGNYTSWALMKSSAECESICLNDTTCAGWMFLRGDNGVCVTVSSVSDESFKIDASLKESKGGRCGPVADLRQLLLPQEKADYPGLDFGNAPASNPKDCSYKCQDTPGCNAYSWSNWNGGTCWMKSGKPDSIKTNTDGSVVSGEVYTCQRPRFDADVVGTDLSSVPRPKYTDCCGVCRRTNGCVGFSWSAFNGGTCWLKSVVTGFKDVEGVISAAGN